MQVCGAWWVQGLVHGEYKFIEHGRYKSKVHGGYKFGVHGIGGPSQLYLLVYIKSVQIQPSFFGKTLLLYI